MMEHHRIATKVCPFCNDIWVYASVGDYGSGYDTKGYKLNCHCGFAWAKTSFKSSIELVISEWSEQLETMNEHEETTSYLCDPFKNIECSKTICHLNGGGCFCTSHKEYAKDAQEDHK